MKQYLMAAALVPGCSADRLGNWEQASSFHLLLLRFKEQALSESDIPHDQLGGSPPYLQAHVISSEVSDKTRSCLCKDQAETCRCSVLDRSSSSIFQTCSYMDAGMHKRYKLTPDKTWKALGHHAVISFGTYWDLIYQAALISNDIPKDWDFASGVQQPQRVILHANAPDGPACAAD